MVLRKHHYKAGGGDRIPVELFQVPKDDAVKVLHSICQQIWKTQQWPQDWKRSVFIPIQRKVMPKNVGNLISGSAASSKSILYIWKFLVHVLLMPSLKDFEHNLASMGNVCNCMVV